MPQIIPTMRSNRLSGRGDFFFGHLCDEVDYENRPRTNGARKRGVHEVEVEVVSRVEVTMGRGMSRPKRL